MKKICAVSGVEFEITDGDIKFYETMGVSAPTLCPEERMRRRLSHRNERNLYRKPCSICNKATITIFSSESGIPIGCDKCWWGDGWNAKKHGHDFDFSRPFFEQFAELQKEVPHMALWNHASQNSEFNNCCFNNKNCYMNFTTDKSEDCYYNTSSDSCKDVVDCYEARSCELCYECVDCRNCYDSKFLQNCKNCQDSAFLKNCIGCSNCFGCVNFRNKQFCFLNEQLTKEEYQQKIKTLCLENYSQLQELRKSFQHFLLQFLHKCAELENCENCTGNYIRNSKNAQYCYDVEKAFDAKYCTYVTFSPAENVMDGYAIGGAKNCLEIMAGPEITNSAFITGINNGPHDSNYCISCVNNCHNCFGCVGLKQSQYCIFNKQYSKDEYFALREKIIAHMKETGEWGEFFPSSISTFSYNETVANEYFPLSKEETLKRGYKWKEPGKKDYKPSTILGIPDSIQDVEDEICDEVLACMVCKKNYALQKEELKFYRKMSLPIPRKCPDCRHADRVKLRNPRELFSRKCAECSTPIQTSFASDRPEKVVCEKCYQNAIE